MMALQQFTRLDLRWSYIAAGVLVIVGGLLNLVLPHGWTIWPIVAAVVGMMMVHEAAERNGQGVPPGHAYAFIFGALFTWLFVGMLLSTVNVFILVLGLIGVFVYATHGYMEGRKREHLRAQRRQDGLCITAGCGSTPAWRCATTAATSRTRCRRSSSASPASRATAATRSAPAP